MKKRKGSSPFANRVFAAFLMGCAAVLAAIEISYFCMGQSTTAKVTHKRNEWRSGGRGGGPHNVLVVEFSYPLPNGELRSGSAELAAATQINEGDALSIEYLPFYDNSSRPKNGDSRSLHLFMIGIITTMVGGTYIFAKLSASLSSRPLETLPDSWASKISHDALVYRYSSTLGRPVSVIVDRTSGLIHFQNCHWLNKFLVVRSEPWFTCSLSKVVSATHDQECEHGLFITTTDGWANILPEAPNFNSLCEELDRSLAIVTSTGTAVPPEIAMNDEDSCARRLETVAPGQTPVDIERPKMPIVYAGTAVVGMISGTQFASQSASTGTLVLYMIIGAIVLVTLVHYGVVFVSRWLKWSIGEPISLGILGFILGGTFLQGFMRGFPVSVMAWSPWAWLPPLIIGLTGFVVGCVRQFRK